MIPTVYEKLNFAVGGRAELEKAPFMPPRALFEPRCVELLQELSERLLHEDRTQYPDLIALGFFLRRAHLEALLKSYASLKDRALGLGVVFHSSPSNVPTNFAYSLVAGLLAGNVNLVRLPRLAFPQTAIICAHLRELLAMERFEPLRPYCVLFSYASDREVTDAISAVSDARIVFGGDENIERLRQSPLKVRGRELNFADRYSLSLINAAHVLSLNSQGRGELIAGLYNDLYLNDQNACSSPVALVLVGREGERAASLLCEELASLADRRYPLAGRQTLAKLEQLLVAAAENKEGTLDYVPLLGHSLALLRADVKSTDFDLSRFKGHSGLLYVFTVEYLEEVGALCSERLQTVTYAGFKGEELRALVIKERWRGVDRIVRVGRALDFGFTWDGIDLIRALSREIAVD